jgi:hypothetical protein
MKIQRDVFGFADAIEMKALDKASSTQKKKVMKILSSEKKCWQCGKAKASIHKAKVITSTGLRELDLCDECHMYWGGD